MKPGVYRHIVEKVQFMALLLVAVTLVCPIKWNALALLFFCFASLLNYHQIRNYKSSELSIQIPLLLYFLLHLVFFIRDPQIATWMEVEMKLALLFLPLILLNGNLGLSDLNKHRVMQGYILSVFCATAICLVIAFLKYNSDGSSSHFYYHALCKPIGHHAVYFSVHVLIAMVFCYQLISEKKHLLLYVALLISFFIVLLLLSSKNVFFCFIVLSLFFFFKKFRYERNLKKVAILLSVAILLLTLLFNSNLLKRFDDISMKRMELLNQDQYNETIYFDGLILRLVQLKFAGQILNEQKAWFQGVGPSRAQKLLDQKYIDHNMYRGADKKSGYLGLNFHNQYAETFVRLGALGLIVLVAVIFYTFKCAFYQKNTLLLAVTFVFMLFFISESVLETQRGVITVAFFICFLTGNVRKI